MLIPSSPVMACLKIPYTESAKPPPKYILLSFLQKFLCPSQPNASPDPLFQKEPFHDYYAPNLLLKESQRYSYIPNYNKCHLPQEQRKIPHRNLSKHYRYLHRIWHEHCLLLLYNGLIQHHLYRLYERDLRLIRIFFPVHYINRMIRNVLIIKQGRYLSCILNFTT